MKRPRISARLTRRWQLLPPRTIRLRLTAVYGGLFLACGTALLAINYGLVSGQLTSGYFARISLDAGKEQIFIARHHGGFASGGIAVSGSDIGVTGSDGGPTTARGFVTGNTQSSSQKAPNGVHLPSPTVLQAGATASSNAALDTLLLESGVALAIMALLAAAVGWLMAGRALRPLRAITAAAQEISASSLHRRLALAGPNDELRQLGRTFDALLERLEAAFTAQRQFAANVSHELRTPLTYGRALIEVALADPEAGSERLRGVLAHVLASGEHQERLIEALLVLSRSQRGLDHREPVDLATIVAQALGGVDAGELTIERRLGPAAADGEPRLLERLVANLVTNAVHYNGPPGRIEVTTWADQDRSILRVTNTGPVIAPEDLDGLFEPFQRIDGTRASSGDGLGLGLSIVKAIADAHSATITTTLPAGGGLSIEVAFPARQSRRPGAATAERIAPAPVAAR